MTQPLAFGCPNCGTSLTVGTTACGRCQLRLTGPDAVRLWEVDQQIGALSAERKDLIGALTGSGGLPPSRVWMPAPGDHAHQAPNAFAGSAPAPAPYAPKKSASGQQVLLGLGALLLLSAASFFLIVVWIVVGVVGQALIMVVLTGVAVAGSVWATRRRLPAVAETAAVIATGFLYLDLSGAHARGLFGLDGLSYADYWVGASVVGGALLVSWDRLVPRLQDGVATRRILTYRPAAAVLFAAAPWFVVASALPERAWLAAAMLVVALTNLACGLVAMRVDEPSATPTPGPLTPDVHGAAATARKLPISACVLFVSAALATVLYALSGLVTGYDPHLPNAERYSAFALLMIVPVALAVLSTRAGSWVTARVGAERSGMIPVAAVAWAAPVLGIPLTDATYPVLVALSVLVAIAVTCVHLGLAKPATETGQRWLQALSVAAYGAQPVLFALVALLVMSEHASLRIMVAFDQLADTVQDPSVLWMVVPAAVWALSSTVGAVRRRSATWAFVAEVALLCTLVAALSDSSARTWMTVLLVALAANVALACVAVRRGSYALAAPAGAGVHGDPFWAGVDRTAVLFSAVYALGALASTFELSAGHQSFVLVTAGVLTLVYAAAPTRLPFAYLGSLAISAGTANLMREAGVETTEAYTAPLALLLAAIGFVQWSRNKTLPTFLTMGPALAVALGPSLLTSLGDGDELRLAAVTLAAIVLLFVGLTNRWKAPVTTGGAVLVVVAITQGGPYVAYVPGWITLGAAGAALLAAGVAWEMAVVQGRRATTWYSSLQ